MALPNTISNGHNPNATKLQQNFEYLDGLISGGNIIKTGTLESLKTTAAAAPTVLFLCWATDILQAMIYCGDATKGDAGFITIGGAAGGTADDITTGDIGL